MSGVDEGQVWAELRGYRFGLTDVDPWGWEAAPENIAPGEYRVEEWEIADRDGSIVSTTDRLASRRIAFDLIGGKVDPGSRHGVQDDLTAAFRTARNAELVELTVARGRPAGQERVIFGRPAGVMFDDALFHNVGVLRARAMFLATDPYAYGTVEDTIEFTGAHRTLFNAAIPFSSQIPFNGGQEAALSIGGEVDPDGVWELVGPLTYAAVSGPQTAWRAAVTVSAGQTLRIDTRSSTRGPRLDTGVGDPVTNWSLLSAGSVLGPVPVGESTVHVGLTGAGTIRFRYRPRYRTA